MKVAFELLVQPILEGVPRGTVVEVLGIAFDVGLPITLADIGLHERPRDRLDPIARRRVALELIVPPKGAQSID
jgi:glycerol dehydrogenase-like iron-containing ADH family enzyme